MGISFTKDSANFRNSLLVIASNERIPQPQTYEQYQPQTQYQPQYQPQPQPQPQTPNNLSTSRHREQNSALQTNYMNSPMQASYCNLTNGGKKLAI